MARMSTEKRAKVLLADILAGRFSSWRGALALYPDTGWHSLRTALKLLREQGAIVTGDYYDHIKPADDGKEGAG